MKVLSNKIENIVEEQLYGLQSSNSDIEVRFDPNFIIRKKSKNKTKVILISGGGSGHEPLHTGFVGYGMLDGACPGGVFSSPSPIQIFECAKKLNNGCGIIFIVKNYAGDIMNFQMATEMLSLEGIKSQHLVVDDDIATAIGAPTNQRRGIAATVIVEKIIGAAAELNYSFEECLALGKKIITGARSFGVALSACTMYTTGESNFKLEENKIELGVGIHGESGIEKVDLMPVDEITDVLITKILSDKDYKRTFNSWSFKANKWIGNSLISKKFKENDEFIILVNGLGGTPLSELYLVYRKLNEICKKKHIIIKRNLIGSYATSLDTKGFSISLIKSDDEIIKLWDKKVKTIGLNW